MSHEPFFFSYDFQAIVIPLDNTAYDPLHTSDHGSGADYLRSNYVQITFCGFQTKNEICSEGYI